jgi:uncharacterized Zn finger protein
MSVHVGSGIPKFLYLKCVNCSQLHRAREVRHEAEQSGSVTCESCGQIAYEWSGSFDLVDWKLVGVRAF